MACGPTGRDLPSKRNSSRERGRRRLRVACAALVTLIAALAIAAPASASEEDPFLLEITTAGFGYGEVECEYKEGAAMVAEAPCEELEFPSRKSIKLIPVAEPGSEFVRFEEAKGSAAACEGETKACSFELGSGGLHESSIEARFDVIEPSLVVNVAGKGTVTCLVEGFPESCEDEYEYEFQSGVEIEPEEEEGWEFAGFRNGTGSASACAGLTKLCSFELEKDTTVEAVFTPILRTLTIGKAGDGQGAVKCNGSPCASKYPAGEAVVLSATPAPGSRFAGWSLEECPGTGLCEVVIEADTAVTATFQADAKPPPPPPPSSPEGEGTALVGAIAKVRSGRARVRLSCTGGPCAGTLRLTAALGRKHKTVPIGRTPFALADGAVQTVEVKLSARALTELGRSRSLRAQAGGRGILAGTVKLR